MFSFENSFTASVPLGCVGRVYSGGTPDSSNPDFWGGDVSWCVPSDLNKCKNRFVYRTERQITDLGLKKSSAKLMPVGSILVCTRASVGEIAIAGVPTSTNQGFKNLAPNSRYDSDYIYYCIAYSKGVLLRLACGSTFLEVSKSDFEKLRIPDLPLPEQKKIAEILGACDEAIEAQERLIAQKQQRKKGLMQQLLTGKKRFPQFVRSEEMVSSRFFDYPEDWSFVKIEDIADQAIRRNSYGELPVLSCTKHSGLVDSLSYFKKQVFAEDTSGYKVVEQGEFAFATNHLEEGSIGYQDLYERAIISPIYCVFKTRNTVDDSWLFPLVKTELYRHIFEANTNSSVNRRGSIRWKEFKSIHVALPSVEEQAAIASVLSACDQEITLQKTKLEQFKQQKKGLMQQLLTGKVRVKV